jgi:hypothetical protein
MTDPDASRRHESDTQTRHTSCMACACSEARRDLALVEEEIASLEVAAREGDEGAATELALLRWLRERIEERLVELVAA